MVITSEVEDMFPEEELIPMPLGAPCNICRESGCGCSPTIGSPHDERQQQHHLCPQVTPRCGPLSARRCMPLPVVTLVADRTACNFSPADKLIKIQMLKTGNLFDCADLIGRGRIDSSYQIMLFLLGIDDYQSFNKNKLKAAVRAVVQATRLHNKTGAIGFMGLFPNFQSPVKELGMRVVNYNRNLSGAVSTCFGGASRIAYLPLHLHFHQKKEEQDQVNKYVDDTGSLTVCGAFLVRTFILDECWLLPFPTQVDVYRQE